MTAGFFTRPVKRFEVPHARVGARWLLVIHACVGKAFAFLRGRGEPLGQASENAITNALEAVLCNEVLLDPVYFRGVTRGSEVENFDGRKIGKKPDLVFHLRRPNELWDQRQDAVFAECKLIGKKHSLAKQYCAQVPGCGFASSGSTGWPSRVSWMIPCWCRMTDWPLGLVMVITRSPSQLCSMFMHSPSNWLMFVSVAPGANWVR